MQTTEDVSYLLDRRVAWVVGGNHLSDWLGSNTGLVSFAGQLRNF
jgi:hypothetical protein